MRKNIPAKLALLVSIILTNEGYPAFWSKSETGRVTVLTDASDEVIAHAIALASVGA